MPNKQDVFEEDVDYNQQIYRLYSISENEVKHIEES